MAVITAALLALVELVVEVLEQQTTRPLRQVVLTLVAAVVVVVSLQAMAVLVEQAALVLSLSVLHAL